VLSAIEVPAINERFVRRNCISYLEQGCVAILAGGTGNPFFSTDTCAALRAAEIDADVIIKATKVDGVYTDDPVTNPSAGLIPRITYQDILHKDLKVIDHAAISICRENNIPIRVINIFKENNIADVLAGRDIGTLISN
jgi:uridylate kinase